MGDLNARPIGWLHRARPNAGAEPRGVLRRALTTLQIWRYRAHTRRHLMTLNDHVLADIGVRRIDLAHEAAKPFWEA